MVVKCGQMEWGRAAPEKKRDGDGRKQPPRMLQCLKTGGRKGRVRESQGSGQECGERNRQDWKPGSRATMSDANRERYPSHPTITDTTIEL